MRIRTHEIDTQARKIVPMALPSKWEFRDITGRDYGIDMELEIFEESQATGQVILFQIKGTEKNISFVKGFASFDIPTKTLIYSERFITPFVLAVCPINNKEQIFYYVWLQEFIKTVLDFENPKWRDNKSTTRIRLPEHNIMPGNEDHLFYVSHFPQRLFGTCEIARILDGIRYDLDGEPGPAQYFDVSKKLEKILCIPGFLGKQWEHSQHLQNQYLNPAIIACKLLASKTLPGKNLTNKLPLYWSLHKSKAADEESKEVHEFFLRCQVSSALECMGLFFEETNYSYKNFLWDTDGSHNF